MTTMYANTPSKEKIARDLADSEQRHLFIEAQIRNGLPLQIRAMREDRGWTQMQVAEKLGTTQNTVSRLENPATGRPTITTLKRIAEVFDVGLLVKFVPFSEYIDSTGGMSTKSVAAPSYDTEIAEQKQKEAERELATKQIAGIISTAPDIMPGIVQTTRLRHSRLRLVRQRRQHRKCIGNARRENRTAA